MQCSAVKISTITATAHYDTINAKQTFDTLQRNPAMFNAVSIFCADENCVKTKFASQNDIQITTESKRFPPQQLSIDLRSGSKASVFKSGQVLIVGARSQQDVTQAIEVVSCITRAKVRSFEYCMINAGFRIKDILVNCAAACKCWNAHFSQYGLARYDSQRHAAVHVKIDFESVKATLLLFRTGTIQMFAAKRMEDLQICQKIVVYFLSQYPTTFSNLRAANNDTNAAKTHVT